ncbi:hypothetical protein ANCCAN_10722, partial [Ancylostoma caninum]
MYRLVDHRSQRNFCRFEMNKLACRRRDFLLNVDDWIQLTLEEYRNSDEIRWRERMIVNCILRALRSETITIPSLPKFTTTPKTTHRTRKP